MIPSSIEPSRAERLVKDDFGKKNDNPARDTAVGLWPCVVRGDAQGLHAPRGRIYYGGREEGAVLPKTWTNIERAVFFLREEKKGVLVNGPAAQFHASGFPGQTGHLQSSRVLAAPDPDGSSDRYTEILWIFRISSHQLSWTWCPCDLVDMDQLVYRHEVSNFNLVFLSNSSSNFNSI